jgi:hypothetical protein
MKLIVAVAWGFLMGLLTIVVGPLSLVSDHPAYAAVVRGLYWLVMPGMMLGTMGGSSGLAVGVNVALHGSLCWLIIRVFERTRGTDEAERDEPAAD